MKVGDRVGDRWEIVGSAPCDPAVGRWRAVDPATGEPAEVLALQPPATHTRAEHGRFLDLHRAVMRAADPALVPVHDVGWTDREAWVARAPLEDATLADVPGPLAPGVVAAIGARLVPAVITAGGATRSALAARDIGLDTNGQPVLAPLGRPGDRIAPDAARHVAPEAFTGAAPDAAAGLYGLGVVLYRLATGRDPVSGAAGGTPVPAGNWVPGMSPALEQALQHLLARDPAQRASALPYLQESALELPDLRHFVRRARPRPATLAPGTVQTTVRAQDRAARHARPDIAHPRAALAIPARALAGLDPEQVSAAAGAAEVPVQWVEELARRDLPLVLATWSSPRAARDAPVPDGAEDLPTATVRKPGLGWLLQVPLALLAGTLLVLALTFGLTALWVASIVATLLLVALPAVRGYRRSQWRAVEAGRKALADGAVPGAEIQARWERIAALRRHLAHSALPEVAATDVRGALRDVERHLADLDRIAATVRDALEAVDASALRVRVATLGAATDPSAVKERDRLARTLADVEAVQARHERVASRLHAIDDALADLEAVIAEVGTRGDQVPAAVEVLRSTTRLARDSLAETTGSRPPPERERS